MRTHFDDWASSAWRSVLIFIGLGLSCVPGAQAAKTSWVPTATQGITLTNFTIQATRLGPVAPTRKMRILVGLRVQNEAQLNSAIAAINTPGNPSYGKFLKPSQFAATYAPSAAQIQAVKSYLAQAGFTNISAPSNGLYLVAYGTAAVVEAAFNTTLWQYQVTGPNGAPTRTVYANTQPAQVPAAPRRHRAVGGRLAKHRHHAHLSGQLAGGRGSPGAATARDACESSDLYAAKFLAGV